MRACVRASAREGRALARRRPGPCRFPCRCHAACVGQPVAELDAEGGRRLSSHQTRMIRVHAVAWSAKSDVARALPCVAPNDSGRATMQSSRAYPFRRRNAVSSGKSTMLASLNMRRIAHGSLWSLWSGASSDCRTEPPLCHCGWIDTVHATPHPRAVFDGTVGLCHRPRAP